MQKYILSVLVENKPGVLSKIAGLFTRRGYNIESLSVGETEKTEISRMTIVTSCDESTFEQITKQVNKMVDVIKVIELKSERSITRDLLLVKVKFPPKQRGAIIQTVDVFRGNIIDISVDTITAELTGDRFKTSAFVDLMNEYEVVELVRTGITGIERCANLNKK